MGIKVGRGIVDYKGMKFSVIQANMEKYDHASDEVDAIIKSFD
jgi:hypothetical protein